MTETCRQCGGVRTFPIKTIDGIVTVPCIYCNVTPQTTSGVIVEDNLPCTRKEQ